MPGPPGARPAGPGVAAERGRPPAPGDRPPERGRRDTGDGRPSRPRHRNAQPPNFDLCVALAGRAGPFGDRHPFRTSRAASRGCAANRRIAAAVPGASTPPVDRGPRSGGPPGPGGCSPFARDWRPPRTSRPGRRAAGSRSPGAAGSAPPVGPLPPGPARTGDGVGDRGRRLPLEPPFPLGPDHRGPPRPVRPARVEPRRRRRRPPLDPPVPVVGTRRGAQVGVMPPPRVGGNGRSRPRRTSPRCRPPVPPGCPSPAGGRPPPASVRVSHTPRWVNTASAVTTLTAWNGSPKVEAAGVLAVRNPTAWADPSPRPRPNWAMARSDRQPAGRATVLRQSRATGGGGRPRGSGIRANAPARDGGGGREASMRAAAYTRLTTARQVHPANGPGCSVQGHAEIELGPWSIGVKHYSSRLWSRVGSTVELPRLRRSTPCVALL